ncbi:hypothetical protein [[Pseudomonas] boreopolis]|uniref:Uncharacterized protein n=1 Tax=Xanthomonas boreopolis TaxID=86183 RepID=A0A919F7I3_9XANT|nr:hypothetical protein GCM10009090_16200 [[Pseudomonas] boreopolis]
MSNQHITPEQRAALERAKRPKIHPYRRLHPTSKQVRETQEAGQRRIPSHARLVRA